MWVHLPRVPADSVRVVTDPAACRRAGLEYARGSGRLTPRLYETAVIRVGDHYLVRSVTAPAPVGEWTIMLVLDSSFRSTISILGF